MKLLQRIIEKTGYISKEKAQSMTTRAYAAAQNNRFTGNWVLPNNATADQDVFWAMPAVRTRARDLAQNNDIVKKYLLLCQQNVVGSDGFILQNRAKDPSGKLDIWANREIEEKFNDWSQKKYCSIDGKMSFRAIQDLLIKTVARDGEVFVRKISGKKVNKYGYALQIIEPDFIDEKLNRRADNGNLIRMGIEINQYRKVTAVYIKKISQEYELYSTSLNSCDYERVPVEQIIHLYDSDRANQTRGISWLAQSMVRIKQLSDFEHYSLINASISAAKMGFLKQDKDNNQKYGGDDSDSEGNTLIKVEPGMFEELPPGMDMVPWNPQFPSDSHDVFVKSMLREIASGLGVSYNTLANDLEGVNYSSIRAGLLDERDNWKRIQSWFNESFLNEVFADWLDWSLLLGVVNLPYSKYDKFNCPTWIGRRWQWVDPLKDVMANKLAEEMGYKTKAKIIGELGDDFYEVMDQRKIEDDYIKQIGIQLGENINGKVTRDIIAALIENDDTPKGNDKRNRKNN